MVQLVQHNRRRQPVERRLRRRPGFSAIELVLVLVVLILATFVSIQFGIALIVKQTVAQAATVAAREAAKGATPKELECIIERVLAGHQIQLGASASYLLERPAAVVNPQTLALPTGGSLPCPQPANPALLGNDVRVTVCVSLTAHPILNILEMYGVDFTGRTFHISAVAKRE